MNFHCLPNQVLYQALLSASNLVRQNLRTVRSPAVNLQTFQSIPSIPLEHEIEMSKVVMVEQVVPVAAPEHAVNKAVAHNRLENSNLQKMANENPSLSASLVNSDPAASPPLIFQ